MLNYKIVANLIEQEDASLTVESLSDRLVEMLSEETDPLPILAWYATNEDNIFSSKIFSAVLITLLRKEVPVQEILETGLLEYFFAKNVTWITKVENTYQYLKEIIKKYPENSTIKLALTELLDFANTHGILDKGFERYALDGAGDKSNIPNKNRVKAKEYIFTAFIVTATDSNLEKLYDYFEETLFLILLKKEDNVSSQTVTFLVRLLEKGVAAQSLWNALQLPILYRDLDLYDSKTVLQSMAICHPEETVDLLVILLEKGVAAQSLWKNALLFPILYQGGWTILESIAHCYPEKTADFLVRLLEKGIAAKSIWEALQFINGEVLEFMAESDPAVLQSFLGVLLENKIQVDLIRYALTYCNNFSHTVFSFMVHRYDQIGPSFSLMRLVKGITPESIDRMLQFQDRDENTVLHFMAKRKPEELHSFLRMLLEKGIPAEYIWKILQLTNKYNNTVLHLMAERNSAEVRPCLLMLLEKLMPVECIGKILQLKNRDHQTVLHFMVVERNFKEIQLCLLMLLEKEMPVESFKKMLADNPDVVWGLLLLTLLNAGLALDAITTLEPDFINHLKEDIKLEISVELIARLDSLQGSLFILNSDLKSILNIYSSYVRNDGWNRFFNHTSKIVTKLNKLADQSEKLISLQAIIAVTHPCSLPHLERYSEQQEKSGTDIVMIEIYKKFIAASKTKKPEIVAVHNVKLGIG